MALPAGLPGLALLLFLPGFSLLTLFKKEATLVELISISLTLSVLLFPMAVLITSPLSTNYAPALLGLMTSAIALCQWARGTGFKVGPSKAMPLLVGAAIFGIVLFVSLKTFRLTDAGMVHGFTHGMDLNFHLSIARRFTVMPHVPPEDPYLPGHFIPYNWFMHVLFGGLSVATGVEMLAVFKLLVPIASALIFLDAYLLAKLAFNEAAALAGSLLYVLGSGLSWLLVLFSWNGARLDLFKCLVYERPGIMNMKYDATALYFFLPQTQLFGLLCMVFGLYLFALAVKDRSIIASAVSGLVLASLVFFHLINAFPVFIALGLFSLYFIFKERKFRAAVLLFLPLLMGGVAVLYQYTLFPANSGSQIAIGQHKDLPVTVLLALGPLLPFGAYGLYRSLTNDTAKLLASFALVNVVSVTVLIMDLTGNTYRFLTYLYLPLSLFSGLVLSGWLASQKAHKMATALAVIALMVPSTFLIADFYNNNTPVTLATAPEVKAIRWIEHATPPDAVIYEKPTYFVKSPVLAGRDVAYSGQAYTKQYHGVVYQDHMDRIMNATHPESVWNAMRGDRVDYVFVGRREADFPFVKALADPEFYEKVYDEDGVRIYKVIKKCPIQAIS
ncbi:hypothetical protein [Methanocella paludicola]|nr:hypothetical protein [Methanocella paludicola]